MQPTPESNTIRNQSFIMSYYKSYSIDNTLRVKRVVSIIISSMSAMSDEQYLGHVSHSFSPSFYFCSQCIFIYHPAFDDVRRFITIYLLVRL